MITPALLVDQPVVVFWHRRDLRSSDNAGLYHALRHGHPVVPLFIFDQQILSKLEYRSDARVGFIHESIHRLKENYELYGSSLLVLHGDPLIIMGELIRLQTMSAVYANEDYEEYGIQRDNRIKRLLAESGISFYLYKDHVVFAPSQVLKSDGSPFTVFTPYMKAWRNRLTASDISPYNTDPLLVALVKTKPWQMPSLSEIGFDNPTVKVPEAR
ncbi:MAG TPA: deoxyribodipyrimidine photo-lyase, partial [Bacteroidales bacterium]|nr:deoxyribodipyrimidine photo-lyase [Bacteroidales bacterium]